VIPRLQTSGAHGEAATFPVASVQDIYTFAEDGEEVFPPDVIAALTPQEMDLTLLVVFGEVEKRWNEDYFPFTEPSYELDIFYEEDWLEVLGCGVIHHEVLQNAGLDPAKVHGWAFGIGLERIAMVLFGINDIRLFWSDDKRFSQQFDESAFANKVKFKPFSKYPPVKKDISMWIPDGFVDNDLFEMIRDEGGDQAGPRRNRCTRSAARGASSSPTSWRAPLGRRSSRGSPGSSAPHRQQPSTADTVP